MGVGKRQEYYFFGWVVVFVIEAIAPINHGPGYWLDIQRQGRSNTDFSSI